MKMSITCEISLHGVTSAGSTAWGAGKLLPPEEREGLGTIPFMAILESIGS